MAAETAAAERSREVLFMVWVVRVRAAIIAGPNGKMGLLPSARAL
jgi:hypothetical protein